MSKSEKLLNAILNDDATPDVEIISRIDKYLSACCEKCGCEGLPTPITRIDHLLYELAEKLKTTTSGNKLPIILGGQATHLTEEDLEGVTALRDAAFEYYYSLKSIVIPESVASIGTACFSSCYYLENITIPSSISNLPVNAFYNVGTGNDGVTFTFLGATPPTKDATTFQNAIIAKIKVPSASVAAYKTAWEDLADYIEAIDNTTPLLTPAISLVSGTTIQIDTIDDNAETIEVYADGTSIGNVTKQ